MPISIFFIHYRGCPTNKSLHFNTRKTQKPTNKQPKIQSTVRAPLEKILKKPRKHRDIPQKYIKKGVEKGVNPNPLEIFLIIT